MGWRSRSAGNDAARAHDGDAGRDSLVFEPTDPDAGGEWELLREVGPSRRTPPWLWAAGLAVVATLLAAVVYGASRAGDSKATPTTPAPTTAVPVTGAPSTAARTASSAPAERSASSPLSVAGTGPVFGGPVGMVLTGLATMGSETWLVTVDLDTGDLQQVPVDAGSSLDGSEGVLPGSTGTVVWGRSAPPQVVFPDGATRELLHSYGMPLLAGPLGETVWYMADGGPGVSHLEQVAVADNAVVTSLALDDLLYVIGADGAGGVLLTGPGQATWRVRPDGSVERLDSVQGSVIAAGPTVLVDERCASPVTCSWVAHPLDRAEGVTLSANGSPASGPAAISPNGQRMAVFVNRGDGAPVQLLVADLLTGGTSSVVSNGFDQASAQVAWVSDDLLLFSQGIDFRAVRVGASASLPKPVVVGGQELRLVAFALTTKPA